MIAEKLDKEKALYRYIAQISNIIAAHNEQDAAIMIRGIKKSAKRVGILEELEKRMKSLSLVKVKK